MEHVRVAIVGSGFSGIGMAIRLRQEGVRDFVVLERANDVGGVWRDNSYPGCACDVQSHLYSFSFARNPDWTRAYSPQEEIHAYLRACAARFGVLPHVRFGHELREAAWDEAEQRWRVETSRGVLTADVLVSAVGALSDPAIPALPGIESFEGRAFHSARWDHEFDLRDKRVAVIGTGASAIQFVPAIQPVVGRLHLFQRTPPWVLPRRDHAIGAGTRRLLRASPLAALATRGGIYALREATAVGFLYAGLGRRVQGYVQTLAERNLARAVPDPVLRAKLTPDYTIGCKRVLISDDYLPSLTRPNVEVVTDAIREVRARAIVASDGVERPVDAIVYGTGFRVQDLPIARRVRGRGGRTLAETWATTMTAHLGTTVAGYPNLFVLQGPNTGLGHTSVITMIESQIEHAIGALAYMRARGVAAVEPRPEAQEAFVRAVDARMARTVWTTGGCRSWYLDEGGRNSTLWPGFTFAFKRRVEPFRAEEYATEAPRDGRADATPALERTAFERLELWGARALVSLPARAQVALAGGAVRRDGQALLPEIQLLLAAHERIDGGRWGVGATPAQVRAQLARDARVYGGEEVPVRSARALTLETDAGPLRARHYAPEAPDGAPLLVFAHGGGFVAGDLDTHDAPCRLLCRHAGVHVLSVDYRLAPEHPFPAAVDDVRAALRFAQAHARELGADPARVAIGGDSAGGNLAAVVSQLAARDGEPAPSCQLLIYPVVDSTRESASVALFADGFFLTRDAIRWFRQQYAAPSSASDPRVSPLLARDLAGLPPALVVTAGFDPLRDEGEAYAAALRASGVRVDARRFEGHVHGFINMGGVSPAAREAVLEIAAALRGMLAAKGETEAAGARSAAGAAA